MAENYRQAVERQKKQIAQMEAVIEWAGRHGLGDLEDDGAPVKDAYLTNWSVCFKISPDLASLRATRKALGPGWRLYITLPDETGTIYLNYYHQDDLDALPEWKRPTIHLEIIRSPNYINGTTCRIETVGTKVVEIKKVICS